MPARDLGPQRQRLHRRDQAVAAERHGEPRDAGGRHQVAVDVVDQQPQVLQRAAQQLVEQLVVGFDLGRGRAPLVVRVAHADERGVQTAVVAPARGGASACARRGTIATVIERDSIGGSSIWNTAAAIGGTTRPSSRGSFHAADPGTPRPARAAAADR